MHLLFLLKNEGKPLTKARMPRMAYGKRTVGNAQHIKELTDSRLHQDPLERTTYTGESTNETLKK
ncbi:hypothetical protein BIV60_12055 [Bacillus sp. MUM 116]|nr:hypothetical protein BIV60_12055 [Bacillus sp. MUM 116]